MVYYRKYRPQTISELDNPKLRETLTAVLSAKEIPHSFLFTGPKGLGKTSTARIIAKVLNCKHMEKQRKGIEPDNICEQCVSITNGTNVDILEIDGASNRGIDEIRELRERVNLAPSSAKKKVYIIDEVHMLTTEAFNALLKTIEEPPFHVVFIFCTTEPQKVPATIISRCFHISLNKATDEELIHSLERIVKQEKIEIDPDGLALLAHLGEGGFRDTQKLFEEVVALSEGKKITRELVEEKLHMSSISYLLSTIVENLSARDIKSSLQTVAQGVEKGIDMKFFVQELLLVFHDIVLNNAGLVQNTKYKISHAQFSNEALVVLIELFQKAYQDTKYAVIPQLPLELACVAWCSTSADDEGVAGVGDRTEQSEGGRLLDKGGTHRAPATNAKPSDGGNDRQDPAKDAGKPTVTDLLKKEKNLKVQAVLGKAPPAAPTPQKEDTHKQENLPEDASGHALVLENIIYKVKPYNHSVAGVLRGCAIKHVDGEKIVFETPYKFHKEKLEEAKTREILEKGVREITGKNLLVMVELKQ